MSYNNIDFNKILIIYIGIYLVIQIMDNIKIIETDRQEQVKQLVTDLHVFRKNEDDKNALKTCAVILAIDSNNEVALYHYKQLISKFMQSEPEKANNFDKKFREIISIPNIDSKAAWDIVFATAETLVDTMTLSTLADWLVSWVVYVWNGIIEVGELVIGWIWTVLWELLSLMD